MLCWLDFKHNIWLAQSSVMLNFYGIDSIDSIDLSLYAI